MKLRSWLPLFLFLLFNLFLLRPIGLWAALGQVVLRLQLLHEVLHFLDKRLVQRGGIAPRALPILAGHAHDGGGEGLELLARQPVVGLLLLGVPLEEGGQGLSDAQPGVLLLVPGARVGVEGGVEVVVVVAVEGRLGLQVLGRQDGADGLLPRVLGRVARRVRLALLGRAGLVLQAAGAAGDGRRARANRLAGELHGVGKCVLAAGRIR
ncbi:uncharacterized protein PG998_012144 [Apiospora kogelbergensis]|uniref:uncharacterized protein n=1 Tax=Apiospora kogelbergensis TaxID=1337665 RepID=UPI003131A4A0